MSAGAGPTIRIGHGFDAHRFVDGRKLVIGGVTIDHPHGLHGHSDADVLVHAVTDAVLGAMALGDLGAHFPSTDERWYGADSLTFLAEARRLAEAAGGSVVQLDATVILQAPHLAAHVDAMRKVLARCLDVDPGVVSIKATTTDGMGWTGRGEGAAATAVVLVRVDDPSIDPETE